jgi:2-polyprenyl-3-methyl-5-hydroxy-6-metoxy-1,4-benzoquinol methylase
MATSWRGTAAIMPGFVPETSVETPSRITAPPPDAYPFGRNWQRYIRTHLSPERERIAEQSLRELLGIDLSGRSFLDIGAGSGLFSLGAYRLGAAKIASVDVDPDAVACCQHLHRREGEPEHWSVRQGSILDSGLVAELEPADVVYSWGVLMCTGDMRRAISNTAELVKPGGLLAIAIYNRVTEGPIDSERWLRIKRAYNRSPRPVQLLMEGAYVGLWALGTARHGANPLRAAREYKHRRGMALMTDVSDWMGGYPYEFATADEIVELCEGQLGLRVRKVVPVSPRDYGNNEFVFERPPQS